MMPRDAHRCRHFNGIQHDACEAGVRYEGMRDTGHLLPCLRLTGRPASTIVCEHRSLLTREELDAEEAELRAAATKALADLAAGQCPTCGKAIEPTKKVGRCLYAACGHRIGSVGR